MLEMDPAFAERPVNEGFSGGEKKRNEILQMAVSEAHAGPHGRDRLRAWTSTRSRSCPTGSTSSHEENPEMTVLLITHYQRLLNYIKPHHVHVMVDGRIVQSGGPEVALETGGGGVHLLAEASTRRRSDASAAAQQDSRAPGREQSHAQERS